MKKQQTDAERIKKAFNDAKIRLKEYKEEQKLIKDREIKAFYEKTIEDIYKFYEGLRPPCSFMGADYLDQNPYYSVLIPDNFKPVELLSFFMDRGFDVKTNWDKTVNKTYLIFDFTTK